MFCQEITFNTHGHHNSADTVLLHSCSKVLVGMSSDKVCVNRLCHVSNSQVFCPLAKCQQTKDLCSLFCSLNRPVVSLKERKNKGQHGTVPWATNTVYCLLSTVFCLKFIAYCLSVTVYFFVVFTTLLLFFSCRPQRVCSYLFS